MPAGRKPAWKRNAVTNEFVEASDALQAEGIEQVRRVNLPSLKSVGISDADRDAIFEFERGVLGTMRATMRIGFRAQGNQRRDADGNLVPMTLVPKKLAGLIPANLERFYQ